MQWSYNDLFVSDYNQNLVLHAVNTIHFLAGIPDTYNNDFDCSMLVIITCVLIYIYVPTLCVCVNASFDNLMFSLQFKLSKCFVYVIGWILILLDEYYMYKSNVRASAPFDHLMACLNNTKAIANLVCLYK